MSKRDFTAPYLRERATEPALTGESVKLPPLPQIRTFQSWAREQEVAAREAFAARSEDRQ